MRTQNPRIRNYPQSPYTKINGFKKQSFKMFEKKLQEIQQITNNELSILEETDKEKALQVFEYFKTFRESCLNQQLDAAENTLLKIEKISLKISAFLYDELITYKERDSLDIVQFNKKRRTISLQKEIEKSNNPVTKRLLELKRSKFYGNKMELTDFCNAGMAKKILSKIDTRTYLTGTLDTFPELEKIKPDWKSQTPDTFINSLTNEMTNCRPPLKKMDTCGVRAYYVDPIFIYVCSKFQKRALYWPSYWIENEIINGNCDAAILNENLDPMISILIANKNSEFEISQYKILAGIYSFNELYRKKQLNNTFKNQNKNLIKTTTTKKQETDNEIEIEKENEKVKEREEIKEEDDDEDENEDQEEEKKIPYKPTFGVITDGQYWQFFKYSHEIVENEPKIDLTRILDFNNQPEKILTLLYQTIDSQLN
ncbi:endonuclease iv endodeoxyribonuclease iv [Anaeramoeba flamelloides]|uniref:Endonuclease iv endodeoxyribonuclease iv n=1 Tax=Anaeramoeba flamelloides TaxID=1746091 RepID=A0AAV8AJB0_9EUKA|nr:endonuclease iv endodeoxyribonuclease iv [Anaeramoeba flamelloides]